MVDRLSPLHLRATVQPISVRQSTLLLPGEPKPLQVTFSAAVQQAPLDTMRFEDGALIKVVRHGAGKVIWAADPVEFSEEYDSTAALYSYAMRQAGVEPAFTEQQPLSPGVLAFPTMLKNAVLYSFASELLDDEKVDITDRVSRAHIKFMLRAQRAAMFLLNRQTGAVLVSSGVE